MKFYDETKPLYIEMDAYGVGMGAALIQTRCGTSCARDEAPDNSILRHTACMSKSLSSTEERYSNIERETLGRLYGLEKFHHYFFARRVSIITDNKLLVAIFKKDMVTLSQRLQGIILRIHQYRVRIIYKPGPDLFMTDWLPRQNHKENRDTGIPGIQLNINDILTSTNIPDCMKYMSYNRQYLVEVCIKFIKCTIKKCIDTKSDIHIALLQIRSTLLGPELTSLARLI